MSLLDYFDEALRLYSADLMYLRPKPHPDLFIEAQRRAGEGADLLFVGENEAERHTARTLHFETPDVHTIVTQVED